MAVKENYNSYCIILGEEKQSYTWHLTSSYSCTIKLSLDYFISKMWKLIFFSLCTVNWSKAHLSQWEFFHWVKQFQRDQLSCKIVWWFDTWSMWTLPLRKPVNYLFLLAWALITLDLMYCFEPGGTWCLKEQGLLWDEK